MATTITQINIVPGRMTSRATALRACINEVCSYARTGDTDDLEDAIRRMRINVTRLETEARLNVVREA
jgi:hypothetical protein